MDTQTHRQTQVDKGKRHRGQRYNIKKLREIVGIAEDECGQQIAPHIGLPPPKQWERKKEKKMWHYQASRAHGMMSS